MGMKLYPPYIEGKLPAQASLAEFRIPFQMNRAVSEDQVKGMQVLIKNIATNIVVDTVLEQKDEINWGSLFVEVDLSGSLVLGQYYKVQLAYIAQDDTVGYYSTAGIVKYTSEPALRIESDNDYDYIGYYSNEGDPSEIEYSYSFSLSNSGGEEIYNTGKLIHKTGTDDKFTWPLGLSNKQYELRYSVTTINGCTASITQTVFGGMSEGTQGIESDVVLFATMRPDDGYVQIAIQWESARLSGKKYRLCRSVENSELYDAIGTFTLGDVAVNGGTIDIYKDFTVEHGVKYAYSIQELNANDEAVSKLRYSEPVFTDFEDIFLFDGQRQLKLRFNPKISSFKTTILESKLDTLGSKYPFFFRNGNTYYKDFPISALISMLSDENELFMTPWEREVSKRSSTPSREDISNRNRTNLDALNIKRERDFKLKVMDWLNNGQPKLFRSPTEGNYLVRLMNISLAPEDTLGRMLHTVSAQAIEIDDNTHQTLVRNEFVWIKDPETNYIYLMDNANQYLLSREGEGCYLVFQEA